ncbi:hypothetical protein ACET3Z_018682 [Daucus carota]
MGQEISCIRQGAREHALFRGVQNGELEIVQAMVDHDPSVLSRTTVHGHLFALHVAAVHDQIEILCMLLDRSVNPDILNRHKQTPLMLAAMSGNISCVERLIQAGANILKFDSLHGRTCLHYAAYYGHLDCLQAILSAAHSSHIAISWGFARFVNVRDGSGATPLHLASRQGSADCIHFLLVNGALVSASTCGYGSSCSYPGSTPLHLAAREGSLDCVRELLAWGGDRLQTDSSGKIPYTVALKHKHAACAALLNPSSPEPLVWPAPLKFISDLNPEARTLLEKALIAANKDRERVILKDTMNSFPSSPVHSDSGLAEDISEASDVDLCSICFEKICTIAVKDCGHQMCAQCMLILCCHNKPNAASSCSKSPLCPFCRSNISELVVAYVMANTSTDDELSPSKPRRSSRRSFNSEGSSSSFKSLSALSSFGRTGGRNSGRVVAECNEDLDKF